ncbi:MAG: sigma-70 family RNA polymerase sigma factor [Clostridia bacterium]|nr:sigma-70 family RNA polymerase sigma factor [Clostridia bacterium]
MTLRKALRLSKTDEEIVLQAQKNDESACEYILNKYKPMVRSVSRTYFLLGGDSDDIVQEGMIGLYRAVCSFSTEEGASFSTYANVCVRRQICTAIKAAARKKHSPLNDYISLDYHDNGELSVMFDPETIIENRERREHIYKEIEEKLSRFEKNVLSEYLKGGTYEEIGAIFGKESKSIDNAIQRIRRKLKGAKV